MITAKDQTEELVRVRFQGSPDPRIGEAYRLRGPAGAYTDDRGRSWRQYAADPLEPIRPGGDLIRFYLNELPGLGPTRSARIWAAFGTGSLKALVDADMLGDVAKAIEPSKHCLGAKIAARICSALLAAEERFEAGSAFSDFLVELEEAGVTDRTAAKRLWRLAAGPDWREKLLSNPYLAASHLVWRHADHLGRRLLRKRGEPDPQHAKARLVGAVDSSFQEVFRGGDTAATWDVLQPLLVKRDVSPGTALQMHVDEGRSDRHDLLWRPRGMRWIEDMLATQLSRLSNGVGVVRSSPGYSIGGDRLIDEQKDVVLRALEDNLLVVNGGAGTGKTATMRVLSNAWERQGGNVELVCISGKAALVLSKATGRLALTCSALLVGLERRAKCEREGLPVPPGLPVLTSRSMLIVDEASMVDTPTLLRLTTALPTGAHLVLVGDPGQLPPVGVGCVFHDLCQVEALTVRLTTIHRQAEENPIPYVAAAIRGGEVPDLPPFEGVALGAFMLECDDAGSTASSLFAEMTTEDPEDCLHLVATNAAVRGVNERYAACNPSRGINRRLGPLATVANGDRIMCVRNRYRDNLRNGQLGRVIGVEGTQVKVHWDGEHENRELTSESAADIVVAWGITVHKAQGSGAKRIIIQLDKSTLINREWLYTAITRAIETVVFVGSRELIADAVSRKFSRTTGFSCSASNILYCIPSALK